MKTLQGDEVYTDCLININKGEIFKNLYITL